MIYIIRYERNGKKDTLKKELHEENKNSSFANNKSFHRGFSLENVKNVAIEGLEKVRKTDKRKRG